MVIWRLSILEAMQLGAHSYLLQRKAYTKGNLEELRNHQQKPQGICKMPSRKLLQQ
jgi:hypothetical protein